jgi:hypothetical protein
MTNGLLSMHADAQSKGMVAEVPATGNSSHDHKPTLKATPKTDQKMPQKSIYVLLYIYTVNPILIFTLLHREPTVTAVIFPCGCSAQKY